MRLGQRKCGGQETAGDATTDSRKEDTLPELSPLSKLTRGQIFSNISAVFVVGLGKALIIAFATWFNCTISGAHIEFHYHETSYEYVIEEVNMQTETIVTMNVDFRAGAWALGGGNVSYVSNRINC